MLVVRHRPTQGGARTTTRVGVLERGWRYGDCIIFVCVCMHIYFPFYQVTHTHTQTCTQSSKLISNVDKKICTGSMLRSRQHNRLDGVKNNQPQNAYNVRGDGGRGGQIKKCRKSSAHTLTHTVQQQQQQSCKTFFLLFFSRLRLSTRLQTLVGSVSQVMEHPSSPQEVPSPGVPDRSFPAPVRETER